MKKVLRKMRRVQEVRPRNQARNVMTGRDGSSVSGTTRATSSTEHRSVSPPEIFWVSETIFWVGNGVSVCVFFSVVCCRRHIYNGMEEKRITHSVP